MRDELQNYVQDGEPPMGLTAAAIISKGRFQRRVRLSMGAGTGVLAGTMAFLGVFVFAPARGASPPPFSADQAGCTLPLATPLPLPVVSISPMPGGTPKPGSSGYPGTSASPGMTTLPTATASAGGTASPGTTASPGATGSPGSTASPGTTASPGATAVTPSPSGAWPPSPSGGPGSSPSNPPDKGGSTASPGADKPGGARNENPNGAKAHEVTCLLVSEFRKELPAAAYSPVYSKVYPMALIINTDATTGVVTSYEAGAVIHVDGKMSSLHLVFNQDIHGGTTGIAPQADGTLLVEVHTGKTCILFTASAGFPLTGEYLLALGQRPELDVFK